MGSTPHNISQIPAAGQLQMDVPNVVINRSSLARRWRERCVFTKRNGSYAQRLLSGAKAIHFKWRHTNRFMCNCRHFVAETKLVRAGLARQRHHTNDGHTFSALLVCVSTPHVHEGLVLSARARAANPDALHQPAVMQGWPFHCGRRYSSPG